MDSPTPYADWLIRTAIANRQLVGFRYQGLGRVAKPHIYGIFAGRAQVAGESSSGSLPNWRRVDASEISGLVALDQHVAVPRPYPQGSTVRSIAFWRWSAEEWDIVSR